MSEMRLRGIAFREVPGWSAFDLDPTTIIPETVPVYVEYEGEPVGTASLRREEDTIWADVTVEDGPWRETCKYLGISFRVGHLAGKPGAGLGEAIGVSLTASVLSNKHTAGHHPPFGIVSETDL